MKPKPRKTNVIGRPFTPRAIVQIRNVSSQNRKEHHHVSSWTVYADPARVRDAVFAALKQFDRRVR